MRRAGDIGLFTQNRCPRTLLLVPAMTRIAAHAAAHRPRLRTSALQERAAAEERAEPKPIHDAVSLVDPAIQPRSVTARHRGGP
jgi:hypothetical protein